jgi:hypothetical protein
MRLGKDFVVNYMSRHNDALWLWLDVKFGRFWYVFMWHKGQRPYMYRSTDATPPDYGHGENKGRWFFVRSVGRID